MSFFGSSSSAAPLEAQPGRFCATHERVLYTYTYALDIIARKEAVKASIREEVALANAQELMNVRSHPFTAAASSS